MAGSYLVGYRNSGARKVTDYGFQSPGKSAPSPIKVNPKVEDLARGRIVRRGAQVPLTRKQLADMAKRGFRGVRGVHPFFRTAQTVVDIIDFVIPQRGTSPIGTVVAPNGWNVAMAPTCQDAASTHFGFVNTYGCGQPSSNTMTAWCLNGQGGASAQPLGTPTSPNAGRAYIGYAHSSLPNALNVRGTMWRSIVDCTQTSSPVMLRVRPGTGIPRPIGDFPMDPPTPVPWAVIPMLGTGILPNSDTRTNGQESSPEPVPDAVISPTRITTAPPGHKPRPPGPGVKERKMIANLPPGLLAKAINAATESRDAVNAIYDALPGKIRKDLWRKYAPKGQAGVIPEVPIHRKIEALYQHAGEIDVGKAIGNLLMNQAEDKAIGKANKLLQKGYRSKAFGGRAVGFGTGPAF